MITVTKRKIIASASDIMPVSYERAAALGQAAGVVPVRKFGRHSAVTTSFQPLALGGIFLTPQVSGAKQLRIAAGGDVNDDVGGTGARKISILGITPEGNMETEELETAGIAESLYTNRSWIRFLRAYVVESGTYATATAGSHDADIVIEDDAANVWGSISSTGFARSQTQIGALTVPAGWTAELSKYVITSDGNKAVDVGLFWREGILDTVPPYHAMRLIQEEIGIQGHFPQDMGIPEVFPPLTDFGFMVKAGSTADVSVDMEILFRLVSS